VIPYGPARGQRAEAETDLLVVGSGIAGLSAALAATDPQVEGGPGAGGAPLRVLILTPGTLGGDGASAMAQGGIAAALSPDDSPLLHARDTLQAGAGRASSERAQLLTADGPARIRALEQMGVQFDREPSGALALALEGAHSRRRVVHALGDRTGWEVMRVLVEAIRARPSIQVMEGYEVLELLRASGGVRGVQAKGPGGSLQTFSAAHTLLATGGAGHLYRRTTTPRHARGDGLALAARAGARLRDLEFVQFHPTALRVPQDPLPLVTEALRGEGAILVDEAGRRILSEEPGGELAPRHRVSRVLWDRIGEGRELFLDAREAVGGAFPQRFPGVFRTLQAFGMDPRDELIPITPAAHYHMGGIEVDAMGRSSVPGLWAAGEVSSVGIHGANRLASNSLLEGLVFGTRVGHGARAALEARHPGWDFGGGAEVGEGPSAPPPPLPHPSWDTFPEGSMGLMGHGAEPLGVEGSFLRLRTLLWEGVGLVRSETGLRSALQQLERLESELRDRAPEVWQTLWGPLFVAQSIARAALARPTSLGSHLRLEDSPTLHRQSPSSSEGTVTSTRSSKVSRIS
jgi:L-aspartate oxidase